jgi:hypothetical protein
MPLMPLVPVMEMPFKPASTTGVPTKPASEAKELPICPMLLGTAPPPTLLTPIDIVAGGRFEIPEASPHVGRHSSQADWQSALHSIDVHSLRHTARVSRHSSRHPGSSATAETRALVCVVALEHATKQKPMHSSNEYRAAVVFMMVSESPVHDQASTFAGRSTARAGSELPVSDAWRTLPDRART